MAAVVAATLGVALVAVAAARVIELGDQTSTALVAPSCPPGLKPVDCKLVLTRDTALATIRDGVSYPTRVNKAGRIVAFSVGLSDLFKNTSARKRSINYLNGKYGGDAQVQVTVLKRIGRKGQKWQVVTQGPIFHVIQYLGSVAQLPLVKSIQVRPGEAIGLTTPTWAPVLSIDVNPRNKFAYRQARGSNPNCGPPATSQQAQRVGEISDYQCKYAGTRIEYAATEVTYPVASNPVH
jgi:hypothetical protein